MVSVRNKALRHLLPVIKCCALSTKDSGACKPHHEIVTQISKYETIEGETYPMETILVMG